MISVQFEDETQPFEDTKSFKGRGNSESAGQERWETVQGKIRPWQYSEPAPLGIMVNSTHAIPHTIKLVATKAARVWPSSPCALSDLGSWSQSPIFAIP